MAVTQTSTLSNARRIQYKPDYIRSGRRGRVYDQFATPISKDSPASAGAEAMAQLSQGGTVRVNYLSDMQIGTTSLSETSDIVPQTLVDAVIDVTVDMYGEAIQSSEKMLIENYTNLGREHIFKVGMNAMESIDNLSLEAGLQGSLLQRVAASRVLTDAGTAGHRLLDDTVWWLTARLAGFNVPQLMDPSIGGAWMALTDAFCIHDVSTAGDLVNVAQYQKGAILLNQELGKLGQFRFISTGKSKIFYGAGAENGTDVDTTLDGAVTALATTIVVAANTNMAVGMWLNITEAKETGNTFYPHNERVKIAAVSGTTITVTGQGDNGGLRFAHASGATVDQDDSVHTCLFGFPGSLVKVWAPSIGQYGDIVIKQQGLANTWDSIAWKHWGGTGRTAEKLLYRWEGSVEEEA